ncbi:uncharacterized protein LY79DRAFT_178157 [Colletotrichum navitas]|uniref:Uncharacterized protein n=1 Tax=Colletotrichum navitas TaxID=681940 RepID=A0AAD8PIK5_9PEZI|nr:uncharacterized protein LY79DRAFT_178157 [Colletotrichum navitas]KAK1561681.1 hypothetical protein LY79DRAFT_178157 [Colletotrichum navitas]
MAFTRIALSALTHCNGLSLVALLPILISGYFVSLPICNIYFHPLAQYPTPRLAAATPW